MGRSGARTVRDRSRLAREAGVSVRSLRGRNTRSVGSTGLDVSRSTLMASSVALQARKAQPALPRASLTAREMSRHGVAICGIAALWADRPIKLARRVFR